MKNVSERRMDYYAKVITDLEEKVWLLEIDLEIYNSGLNDVEVKSKKEDYNNCLEGYNKTQAIITQLKNRAQYVTRLMHQSEVTPIAKDENTDGMQPGK